MPAVVKELKASFDELQQKAKEFVVNNEYFDMVMQQGDTGVNAYTSSDATQYINSLPANKLEFWMAITSDRFLNPVFREFYKERDVIMEERRLGLETQPIGKLLEDFVAAAFKAHPYHHEVVGHMSDLQRIRHQDVKDYFKKYYSPSNLTAAIVGDVDPAGGLPAGRALLRAHPQRPEARAPAHQRAGAVGRAPGRRSRPSPSRC